MISTKPLTGLIFDIRRFSIHDGPGIRTAVFFKGCPLQCLWCHNPESQSPQPELMLRPGRCIRCGACAAVCGPGAIAAGGDAGNIDWTRCNLCGSCVDVCCTQARERVGRAMTVGQVLAEVEKDVAFFDESRGGVTLTGGEPLNQKRFLQAFLFALKEHEIHTAVDTCGFASAEALAGIVPWVDLFLYDLKTMDDAAHRRLTGVSNQPILANLRMLSERGQRIFLRVPIIPGVNDDAENIRRTGELAASLRGVERVDLLPYHHAGADKYERLNKAYALGHVCVPSDERMLEIEHDLQALGLTVQIGG